MTDQKKINKGVISFFLNDKQKEWVKQEAKFFGLTQSKFLRCRVLKENCAEFRKLSPKQQQSLLRACYPHKSTLPASIQIKNNKINWGVGLW